jgi:hypothetical protein
MDLMCVIMHFPKHVKGNGASETIFSMPLTLQLVHLCTITKIVTQINLYAHITMCNC